MHSWNLCQKQTWTTLFHPRHQAFVVLHRHISAHSRMHVCLHLERIRSHPKPGVGWSPWWRNEDVIPRRLAQQTQHTRPETNLFSDFCAFHRVYGARLRGPPLKIVFCLYNPINLLIEGAQTPLSAQEKLQSRARSPFVTLVWEKGAGLLQKLGARKKKKNAENLKFVFEA